MVTKTCKKCLTVKPLEAFSPAKQCRDGYRPECKACHNLIEKARDKSHRVTITYAYKRAERLMRVFGISLEQYDQMLVDQEGLCAICRQTNAWNRREGADLLVVDHDHVTGKVRGLLCHGCNQALGLMRDSKSRLLAAVAYLDEAEGNQ